MLAPGQAGQLPPCRIERLANGALNRAMAISDPVKVKLQVLCGDDIAMGPGKADLLDAIDQTGSISAAARAMDMSYRRAWLLVDTMNRCWVEPVVETVAGGSHAKGAVVSAFGKRLLRGYRDIEAALAAAATAGFNADMAAHLRDVPRPGKHKAN